MLHSGPTESEEVWVRYVQREPGERSKDGFMRGERVYFKFSEPKLEPPRGLGA